MKKQSDESRVWEMTFCEITDCSFQKVTMKKINGRALFQITRDFGDITKCNAFFMFGPYSKRHFGNNWEKFEYGLGIK